MLSSQGSGPFRGVFESLSSFPSCSEFRCGSLPSRVLSTSNRNTIAQVSSSGLLVGLGIVPAPCGCPRLLLAESDVGQFAEVLMVLGVAAFALVN